MTERKCSSIPPGGLTRRDLFKAAAGGCVFRVAPGWARARPGPDAALTVDSHAQVWQSSEAGPEGAVSRLLERMQANGVDRSVLIQPLDRGWDCADLGSVVKAHPNKFVAVCRVDPTSKSAPDALSRWVEKHGFRGLHLSPHRDQPGTDWFADRSVVDPLLERASRLKLPISLEFDLSRSRHIEGVLERHQKDLDVCIDHVAGVSVDEPFVLKRLLLLARYPRVYVKLSDIWSRSKQDYPYRDTYDLVWTLYHSFGPSRLLWGSDFPNVERRVGYAKALSLFRQEIPWLADEDRRWILGKTALKLWPLS